VSAPSGAAGSTAGGRAITSCSAHELVRRGPGFARTPGGWSAGDRVALIGDLSVDLLAAFVTLRERGLCPVPLDSSFNLEETAFALNDSRARQVVLDRDHAALAEQLRPLTPYVESWTVLHPGPAVAPVAGAVRLGEPCGSLHYSAAPTGRPVGYSVPDPVAHDAGRRDLGALLGDRAVGADDVVLLATSLSDPAAAQLCIAAVEEGALLVLGHGVGAPDLLSAIDEHRPTVVHLSPATALAVAKAYQAGAVSVWPPELALITAPGCPPSVTRGLIESWGPVLRLVYLGPGVGAVAAHGGLDVLLYPGSAGRPLDDVGGPRIRIAPGSGLIEAEHPDGSGDWVSWGDRGMIDRGRLTVLDQHQAGLEGERWLAIPQAVETALVGHPSVADAAVVTGRSGRSGRPMTYVQATPEVDPAGLEDELLAWLVDVLPGSWVPDRITVVPALPRTGAGKLDRRRLLTLDPFDGRDPA